MCVQTRRRGQFISMGINSIAESGTPHSSSSSRRNSSRVCAFVFSGDGFLKIGDDDYDDDDGNEATMRIHPVLNSPSCVLHVVLQAGRRKNYVVPDLAAGCGVHSNTVLLFLRCTTHTGERGRKTLVSA